jgi:outer membrane protein
MIELKVSKLTFSEFVTKKFLHSGIARVAGSALVGLSLFAAAQTAPATSAPATADAPNAPSAAAAVPKATGTKVGTINIEQAIFASNEGRRDFEQLSKKFEPKQNELKGSADEIDSLKKQLNAQQDKLNEESRDKLMKQIEAKQKVFDRSTQDAQEDFQNQQGEIGNKILTKMAPMIVKFASDNGYGMILDTSQQWPRGPVIWYGPAVDITQPIVEAYNTQSGVPAPAPGSTATKPVRPTTTPGTKTPTPAPKTPTSNPPKQ